MRSNCELGNKGNCFFKPSFHWQSVVFVVWDLWPEKFGEGKGRAWIVVARVLFRGAAVLDTALQSQCFVQKALGNIQKASGNIALSREERN